MHGGNGMPRQIHCCVLLFTLLLNVPLNARNSRKSVALPFRHISVLLSLDCSADVTLSVSLPTPPPWPPRHPHSRLCTTHARDWKGTRLSWSAGGVDVSQVLISGLPLFSRTILTSAIAWHDQICISGENLSFVYETHMRTNCWILDIGVPRAPGPHPHLLQQALLLLCSLLMHTLTLETSISPNPFLSNHFLSLSIYFTRAGSHIPDLFMCSPLDTARGQAHITPQCHCTGLLHACPTSRLSPPLPSLHTVAPKTKLWPWSLCT